MAGIGWPTNDDLRSALLNRGWEFEFSQAVTLLERFTTNAISSGLRGPFAGERIRFAPSVKLAPTASEVQSIARVNDADTGAELFRVTISFFGLYGMSAPGPAYMFEAATGRRDAEQGEPLRHFLDLFNNRFIALYYRAWRKYRWPLEFRDGATDPMSRRVYAFLGLATPVGATPEKPRGILAEHSSLQPLTPRARLLRYIGLFSQRVRCPANLRGLLWDYFDGPDPRRDEFVEVEEFMPRWFFIEAERRCKLGLANSRLGGTADSGQELIVGERIRDRLGQFRIVIGPVDLETFRGFLPNGASYGAMLALVDLYRPDRLDYDIKLRLRAEQVPPLRIGRGSEQRLGWSTWVQTPAVPRREEGVVTFQRRILSDVGLSELRRTA